MKTSTYNKVLIISFICIALPLSFFVFWLEPYTGDLARIGGFKENEYGWNSFQKRFKKCHYTLGANIKDYNKHFDIVTIGDSFSVNEAQSWQNYLALSSNASLLFIGVLFPPPQSSSTLSLSNPLQNFLFFKL